MSQQLIDTLLENNLRARVPVHSDSLFVTLAHALHISSEEQLKFALSEQFRLLAGANVQA